MSESGQSSQSNTQNEGYTVNLDTLRACLTAVRNGLNKGCEKGAYSLEEAEALAQSVKYLVEVSQLIEKTGVRKS